MQNWPSTSTMSAAQGPASGMTMGASGVGTAASGGPTATESSPHAARNATASTALRMHLMIVFLRPMRIVSLIASSTEIICALGFEEHLVGRSHECDFPAGVKRLPVCTEPKFPTDGTSYEIDQRV